MYSVHLPNSISLSHPVSVMTFLNLLFIFFNFHHVYKALKNICYCFACLKLVYKFLQLACFAQYTFYENYPYWYKLFIHFFAAVYYSCVWMEHPCWCLTHVHSLHDPHFPAHRPGSPLPSPHTRKLYIVSGSFWVGFRSGWLPTVVTGLVIALGPLLQKLMLTQNLGYKVFIRNQHLQKEVGRKQDQAEGKTTAMWTLKPWLTRRGTWEGGSGGLQNRPWKPQRAGSQDLCLTQTLALGCPGEDVTLGEAAQIAEADAEADNSWRTWPQLLGRKGKSLSNVWLFVTPWTVAWQAPLSMEFSRQEYWRGLPCPSPGDLPDPGFKLRSLALQADSLPRLQGLPKGSSGQCAHMHHKSTPLFLCHKSGITSHTNSLYLHPVSGSALGGTHTKTVNVSQGTHPFSH